MRCLICTGKHFEPLDARRLVQQCQTCGLGVQVEIPDDVAVLYTREAYDRHQRKAGRPSAWQRFHYDLDVAFQRLDQLKEPLATLTNDDGVVWMDIGCGVGAHLVAARRMGYVPIGVELHQGYCDEIDRTLHLVMLTADEAITCGSLPEIGVISFFDVIEHLVDPVGFIKLISRRVKPGGLIILETPDLDQCDVFDGWAHYRPGEHLTYWTAKTFRRLIDCCLTEFEEVLCAFPVPDKLQFVLRRKTK